MKVIVTGGAGFIGSNLVDGLINAGAEVLIVDNLSTGRRELINSKARFNKLDICDGSELSTVINNFEPNIIYHLAAQMDVRKSVADPQFDAQVNIVGGLNLLEAARQCKTLKKIVFASTGGAIYGEQDYFPADEQHSQNPVSPYGIAKLALEKYLHFYHRQYGIKYTALRFANVYGPRQNPHGEAGVVAIFFNKILNNENLLINGKGEQTRDFVFVQDVVRVALEAGKNQFIGCYNIGTAIETDINTLAQTILKVSGAKVSIEHREQAVGEQMRSVISSAKLEKDFKLKISTSLEEGLDTTWQYFKGLAK